MAKVVLTRGMALERAERGRTDTGSDVIAKVFRCTTELGLKNEKKNFEFLL